MTAKSPLKQPRQREPQYRPQRAGMRSEADVIDDWLMEDADDEAQAAFKAWMLDEADADRRAALDVLVRSLTEDEYLR